MGDAMSYVALYRTYRPQGFKDVAGQEHITTTLKNALKTGKVAHAYLFSGPRGTGKTTIAKIMAKAVNCENGPTDEPCNECETCKGITKGMVSDVIEIDAASNNGVDEIRELRDRVKYLPSVGKYKVYIIDEVHMLSTGAFNALLKTLEEPPKHVIFILATTEPYKIPPTILSRCQRFDFRGISVNEIIARLKEVVAVEKTEIDDEAIRLIAESAEGGMRDALSLLDQAISFSGTRVKVSDVHTVSGSVATEKMIELVHALQEKNIILAMQTLELWLDEGKEIPRIISDLIQFLRDILIYKNVDVSESQKAIYTHLLFQSLASRLSNQKIYLYLEVLNKTQNDIKWTNQKRAYLELALIKMSDDVELRDVENQDKIAFLERRLMDMETQIKKMNEKLVNGVTGTQIKTETIEKSTEIIPLSDENKTEMVEVKDVERVLHAAIKEKKELLSSAWPRLYDIKNTRLQVTARLLASTSLGAASDKEMVLVAQDAKTCAKLMQPKVMELVKEILNAKSTLVEHYICVPKHAWDTLMDEYVTQWKQGNKKPTLTAFELGVYDEPSTEADYDERPETLRIAHEFFGEDIVKVKEKRK